MENKIKYEISEAGNVTVKVVDIIGTPVRVILNEHKDAGSYEVSLDDEALSPGKYYYKVLYTALNGHNGQHVNHNKGETIASGQVKIEV